MRAKRGAWAVAVTLGATTPAWAGDLLYLKTRTVDTAGPAPVTLSRARTLDASRRRIAVQFESAVAPWRIDALERRGARAIQPLPTDGVVMSWPEGADLGGLGVKWIGALDPEDKISPSLEPLFGAGEGRFAVEPFPGVSEADVRSVALACGIRTISVRQPFYVMEGSRRQSDLVAEWDEIAYVFPAPETPGPACQRAGGPGQYAAISGATWADRATGAASLGYNLDLLAGSALREPAAAAAERALAEWSRYAELAFRPESAATAPRTIAFQFGRAAHGDSWPFDGPGRTLAHAFYPEPLHPEPFAGDVHLDADEDWGGWVDLYSAIIHEAGHALGLVHSDDRSSVMYPFHRKATGLGMEDIAVLRSLYAPRIAAEERAEAVSIEPESVTPGGDGWVVVTGRAEGPGPFKLRWRGSASEWTEAVGAYSWSIPVLPVPRDGISMVLEARQGDSVVASRRFRVTRDGIEAEATAPDASEARARAGR